MRTQLKLVELKDSQKAVAMEEALREYTDQGFQVVSAVDKKDKTLFVLQKVVAN